MPLEGCAALPWGMVRQQPAVLWGPSAFMVHAAWHGCAARVAHKRRMLSRPPSPLTLRLAAAGLANFFRLMQSSISWPASLGTATLASEPSSSMNDASTRIWGGMTGGTNFEDIEATPHAKHVIHVSHPSVHACSNMQSYPDFIGRQRQEAADAFQRARLSPRSGLLRIKDVIRRRIVAEQCEVFARRPPARAAAHGWSSTWQLSTNSQVPSGTATSG